MLSKEMTKALNDQMVFEIHSGYIYLAMAAKLEKLKLPGMAHWMRVQAGEELGHAERFRKFLNDHDADVEYAALAKPEIVGTRPVQVFEQALKHEEAVTVRINRLYGQALTEKAYSAVNFLDWFVDEQVEEEKSVRDIIDRLNLADGAGEAVLYLNDELGGRGSEESAG
ncbi:MAG: ferritin [Lentisphaeria bacterium]|nr:ferritin [Lentisphaeria bacterium]